MKQIKTLFSVFFAFGPNSELLTTENLDMRRQIEAATAMYRRV